MNYRLYVKGNRGYAQDIFNYSSYWFNIIYNGRMWDELY